MKQRRKKSCAVIDDRIKAAFEAVLPLATDGAQHAHLAAVLLQSGSAVATNGHVLAEYWHGIDLPPMLIPKASAVAILKAGKGKNLGTYHSLSDAKKRLRQVEFFKHKKRKKRKR